MVKLDSQLKSELKRKLEKKASKQRIKGTRRDALVYDTLEDSGYGPRRVDFFGVPQEYLNSNPT